MSSDSTAITSADAFAHNSRSGFPTEDVIGTFDISRTLEPTFHRGSAGDGFERGTVEPDPPGTRRLQNGERVPNRWHGGGAS